MGLYRPSDQIVERKGKEVKKKTFLGIPKHLVTSQKNYLKVIRKQFVDCRCKTKILISTFIYKFRN